MSLKQGEDPEMSESGSVLLDVDKQDEQAMCIDENGEFDKFCMDLIYRDSITASGMDMYREFYAACRLGNVDVLKESNCLIDQFQHCNAVIYAVKNKQREVYIFLLQEASKSEWKRSRGLRDTILIKSADLFTRKNDLETIEWLVSGELNSTDAVLICNEVLYSAAYNRNVPLADWVLNKYEQYVDITHENHRTLKSVLYPLYPESFKLLFDEYQKSGKRKILLKVLIAEAIKHKDADLVKVVIEAGGYDVRRMKPNSKMDPTCRAYLMSVIEQQKTLGIEKWKEAVRTKKAADSKPKKIKQW